MSKFCPNCGNQMGDNAKFCMECGAKLGDYTSGGIGIKDNVIQRSRIGSGSVGNVEISPTINATATAAAGYACRLCGSPAAGKCGFYTCGKCLKKVYLVEDIIIATKEEVGASFLCKECSESHKRKRYIGEHYRGNQIYCRGDYLELGLEVGYFTEDDLRFKICEKCKSFFARYHCIHCGKMFCNKCLEKKEIVFRWNEVPGTDESKFQSFMADNFGIGSTTFAKIGKIDDGNAISAYFEYSGRSALLRLNDKKTEVSITTSDGKEGNLLVTRTKDGDIRIERKVGFFTYREGYDYEFRCPVCNMF